MYRSQLEQYPYLKLIHSIHGGNQTLITIYQKGQPIVPYYMATFCPYSESKYI
jgi:hypothetical protein